MKAIILMTFMLVGCASVGATSRLPAIGLLPYPGYGLDSVCPHIWLSQVVQYAPQCNKCALATTEAPYRAGRPCRVVVAWDVSCVAVEIVLCRQAIYRNTRIQRWQLSDGCKKVRDRRRVQKSCQTRLVQEPTELSRPWG